MSRLGWMRAGAFSGLALAFGTSGGGAQAQSYSFFYGLSGTPLNGEDIQIIERSAAPLFADAPVGAIARWQNPNTGNSGSLRLNKIYELKQMECRQVSYTLKYTDRRQPSLASVDWCRLPTGEWKLVDPLEVKHH